MDLVIVDELGHACVVWSKIEELEWGDGLWTKEIGIEVEKVMQAFIKHKQFIIQHGLKKE